MNTLLAKLKHIAILLAGISTASIPALAHADWSMTGLGTLGGSRSYAYGINDSGQVVGFSSPIGESYYSYLHAFITGPNGAGMTDLGTLDPLDGSYSFAYGINDSGQVTGYDGYHHAFITGPNGVGMTDLGTLGGRYSHAQGINNSGQVVGDSGEHSLTPSIYNHAFITGPDGIGMTDLGTLGGSYSYANGINDSGQAVGGSQIANGGAYHAFITGPNGAGMTDLGTLGGFGSYANGINNSGQAVGDSQIANGISHAFITGSNGIGMIDLGTLGGTGNFDSYYASATHAINDLGEVVGSALTADGYDHPFLFSHGGMTDLALLDIVVSGGWSDLIVNDINNNGQIVGYGINNSGIPEAFILSYTPDTVFNPQPIFIPPDIPPVPEPETYAMLLAGLGLVGFMARRRKKASV